MATVRVQLRRGTEQQWYDANPVLAAGEVGIETDTNTFKFGDGTTAWRVLDYALSDTVDDYIPLSTKGVANGVASLDASGFIPTAQLPPLAKVTVSAVANTAARLALTAEAGDIAIEADSGQSYVLSASPASTDANWKALVGSEAVVDLANAALVASTGLSKTYDDSAGTITFSASSAISTAAADATDKVAAEAALRVSGDAASVSTAASDATAKVAAEAALRVSGDSASVATAASDATAKANSAIDTAASDATTKANAAQAAAIANTTTQINNLIDSAPGTLNTLGEIATALAADESAATALTTLVNTKAPLASPTFTGVVTIPSGASISGFAPLAAPTFTGTVTLPASTSIGNVTNVELSYLDGVTSTVQGQIDAKLLTATAATTYAPLASPTLTGTVTLPESTSIGNVSNLEIGYVNGVTSAIQTQIDTKAPLASPTFTGTVTLPALTVSSSMLAADAVTSGKIANGTIINEDISATAEISTSKISGLDTALGLKAPLASPTFTGTVTLPAGTITSGMILDGAIATADIADSAITSSKIANGTIMNADINASAEIDQSKISGLSTSLGLKADLASPTFTGVPVAPTAAVATNTTQIATTAYVRGEVAALVNSAGATLDTLGEIATALGNDASLSTTLTNAIALKAPLASPTFTGTNTVAALTASGLITASASGVAFTDGTQTKAGIPSLTTIGTTISAAYNLSTGGLTLRDQLIPISGTYVVTVPTNATTAFPVGTSIDFYQSAGTVASFAGAGGVTIQATPGLKLRTTYSSATLTKVATDTWLLAGDLTA